MKTSTLIIIGALAYLWYKSKNPSGTIAGPPTPGMDFCNGLSPVFNPGQCLQSGRTPYFPVDTTGSTIAVGIDPAGPPPTMIYTV
jgi:hypothetical protein